MPKSSSASLHADVAQLLQRLDAADGVLDQQRLGDLEHEPAGSDAGALDHVRDRLQQVGLLELDRRQVHLHLDVGVALADARARLLEHVPAERHDQAGVFRERDELDRGDAAAARVVPAHERLDGDGLSGDEIDDRLVLDDELVAARSLARAQP